MCCLLPPLPNLYFILSHSMSAVLSVLLLCVDALVRQLRQQLQLQQAKCCVLLLSFTLIPWRPLYPLSSNGTHSPTAPDLLLSHLCHLLLFSS